MFEFFCALTAFAAAIVAAISGFGIGSLLTPLLSTAYDAKIAIALVAIPHAFATGLRLFYLRKNIDRKIFIRFGLASAAGGLAGAFIHSMLDAKWLGTVLGVLLVFAGFMNLSGKSFALKGAASAAGGILSGVFGGLVGNQGGIRAAALTSLNLSKETLVAVSTASALLVDAARLPVYIWKEGAQIAEAWPLGLMLCAAGALGTFAGMGLLKKINETIFKRILGALLIALGVWMFAQSLTAIL